jgi:hypothetical protein
MSKFRGRECHVNLLLLQDAEQKKSHYVYVSDLSRLVAGRTEHDRKVHACKYCFHCFAEKQALDKHLPECSIHPAQHIRYPEEDWEKETHFKAFQKQLEAPFAIYVDFESFLPPCEG